MKRMAPIFLFLALAACLAYGIARLFEIRFAKGDVYSPYSTYRTDGPGTKALHDSLSELMPVRRNTEQAGEFRPDGNSTIFFLGVEPGLDWDETYLEEIQAMAHDGNRVVVAHYPGNHEILDYEEDEDQDGGDVKKKEEKTDEQKKAEEKKEKAKKKKLDIQRKALGATIAYSTSETDFAISDVAGLEPRLSWHSSMYFDGLDSSWRVLYKAGGKPAVIERSVGKGSLVLASDSYFASNEALSKERAPGFLAALVGNSRTVVFDETHLGVAGHQGVASLIRKYRLHYVVLALACVAALFVWRNAVSFVPPAIDDTKRADVVEGADAASGFVGLLKRNIPFNRLIETCVAEWKRSFGHKTKSAVLARVEPLARADGKQSVEIFQAITQILNEKH